MAQDKSGAERARRHRDRKRCGNIIVQYIEITRPGVEALVARGLLDDQGSGDPHKVRAALVELLNHTLTAPPPPQPFRQALRSVTLGLF